MTLTDLPDEISPFPLAGNLIHTYQTSSESEFRSSLPLQKLRPVRNNQYVTEYSDFPTIVDDSGFLPENEGSLIENLEYNHQVGDSAPPVIEAKPGYELVYRSGDGGKDSMEWNYSPTDEGEKEGGGGGGGGAGNRWPEAETLALLKIRSEMDAQFRETNPKGPLWEIISRKLEHMGYHRDSKKCSEKFKNVYKYYKKTKERLPINEDCGGGKIYKFFSELKAFDNQHNDNNPIGETSLQDNTTIIQTPDPVESSVKEVGMKTSSYDGLFGEFSLDDDDDEEEEEGDDKYDELEEENVDHLSRKRKRGRHHELKLYCENLVKEMMKKQEQMYRKLMETVGKMEKDRIMREEAWKRQEMERVRRDKEMRDRETARNLALISFIEKYMGQQIPIQVSPESYQGVKHEEPELKKQKHEESEYKEEKHEELEYNKFDSNNRRWPKLEVQALITLRTAMDHKYRNTVPKGPPLWEEISLAMSSLGYSRSAKKCKEKWENINKYFKRATSNGKKRSENEKRCPYFHELDILYKNRLLNPEKPTDEMNDEGKERTTNEEMLTTLAQVCNLFSMSEPLEPVGNQSGRALV